MWGIFQATFFLARQVIGEFEKTQKVLDEVHSRPFLVGFTLW
jgi:hypothetical protein